MKKGILLSALLGTIFLSGCSSMPEIPDMSKFIPKLSLPVFYKNDVKQGSVLTRFAVNQLKVGMSKTQVQNLLGSPSIIDPFHNNQWDYINHSTLHEKDDTRYRLTLKFQGDALVSIDTSQLQSLPALTDPEKKREQERINAESKATEISKNQVLTKTKAKQIEVLKTRVKTISQEQGALAQKQLETIKAEQTSGAPTPKVINHVIKQGETLWHIAQTYGIDVNALAKQNKITVNSTLNIGQQLIIVK